MFDIWFWGEDKKENWGERDNKWFEIDVSSEGYKTFASDKSVINGIV